MTTLADNSVTTGDCLALLPKLADESIHLILTDIPYGIGAEEWDVLHSNTNSALLGNSPAQRKAGAVFKKRGKPINGWSEADKAIPREYQAWCSQWASQWYRVLKPGASAIVFAGRRYAHRCIVAMEDAGFSFKDMLAWQRQRAPHRAQRISLVYQRRGQLHHATTWQGWRVGHLRPVFEPVLWFTKPYPTGGTLADTLIEQGVGAYNETAFLQYESNPNNVLSSGFTAGESGLHPTQKPVRLMQSLIALTTQAGQLVLDPFCGSGSTLVAAHQLGRRYLGFDTNPTYTALTEYRLTKGNNKK
jgi:site-specific DNA-methyltransferase (adenine-specific)